MKTSNAMQMSGAGASTSPLHRVEEEFAKDIWDARVIPGARYMEYSSNHLVNFTQIPLPFRPLVKQYLQYLISSDLTLAACNHNLRGLRTFFSFLGERSPLSRDLVSLTAQDIDAYLQYLKMTPDARGKERSQVQKSRYLSSAQGVVQIKNDGTPAKVRPEELLQGNELELAYIRANLDAIRLPNGYCFKPKTMDCPAATTPCYTCRAFVTTPTFLPQLEQEIRGLETQVELGEAAGQSHWVEANRRKLIKLTPIVELPRTGQIHQPLEKHKREYTHHEDKNQQKPSGREKND